MRTLKITHQHLQRQIIREIRLGRCTSRGLLAEELHASPSTIGLYVDRMIANGFLEESGLQQSGVGRPKRLLRAVRDAGWFAGLEFSGGILRVTRVDFDGTCAASFMLDLPMEISRAAMLQALSEALNRLRGETKMPLLGVGVGAPGFIDAEQGIVRAALYPADPDWKNVPLAAELSALAGVPVQVCNNLNAIAYAEYYNPAALHAMDDFAVARARKGFGFAMMKRGQFLPGAHQSIGEIGNWPWPLPHGPVGELHQRLSADAIWTRLAGTEPPSQMKLREEMTRFANLTGPAWDELVSDFTLVFGMAQMIIDTGEFILHGPLNSLGQRFCEDIEKRALEMMPLLANTPLKVRHTTLASDAGSQGAAMLAMDAWDCPE